ncbi:hypothetical protein NDU88_005062 [Pleurodeles waltl]|uniref:Uncharacterized protein n=1 Tax=Pleurodeles waltl TaxID=8319 RepID=A0AAV7L1N3_PLEWA|nr:hypothetical protein NDU88_005062 [Pleurodeles waltl]
MVGDMIPHVKESSKGMDQVAEVLSRRRDLHDNISKRRRAEQREFLVGAVTESTFREQVLAAYRKESMDHKCHQSCTTALGARRHAHHPTPEGVGPFHENISAKSRHPGGGGRARKGAHVRKERGTHRARRRSRPPLSAGVQQKDAVLSAAELLRNPSPCPAAGGVLRAQLGRERVNSFQADGSSRGPYGAATP